MKDAEIREMLKDNTNMSSHDIEEHIKDGVIVYSSFEEFKSECIAIGYDEDSELDLMVIQWTFDNKLDKMTYKGNTYYVDFIL